MRLKQRTSILSGGPSNSMWYSFRGARHFDRIDGIPMMLSFYLDRVKAETVQKALGIVIRANDDISSNSEALWLLADNFLKSQTIPNDRG